MTMNEKIDNTLSSRAGRALNDLVMAELFLVQATIESATALGDGISEMRDQPREELPALLKRTRSQVTEPYVTRFKYLRELIKDDLDA